LDSLIGNCSGVQRLRVHFKYATKTRISGLLTSIGKTTREVLISRKPTKFVVKICVNSRCNKFIKNKWNDNLEKGNIDALYFGYRTEIKN
jgi:hypothetical protein